MDAQVYMRTNSTGVRIEMADGTTLTYDGENVFMSPENSEYGLKKARFDIFTWTYFFAFPYKVKDPGTFWELTGEKVLDESNKKYETAKLTFGENIGDAPDDWYWVYKDKETNRIKAAAYIVTFSSSAEKANENPHAISYDKYELVNGIPVSTEWGFWDWNEETGISNKRGFGTLSGFEFVKEEATWFQKGENAVNVPR